MKKLKLPNNDIGGRCFLLVGLDIKSIKEQVLDYFGILNFEANPDVFVLDNSEKNILVKDISKLIEKVSMSPITMQQKIFIILDAEYLSSICQNKLLKTIEELPHDSVLFLIASGTNNILNTIKSRSFVIHTFSEVLASEIVDLKDAVGGVALLEKKSDNQIYEILYSSAQNLGLQQKSDTLKLLDQLMLRFNSNCNKVNSLDWFFLKIGEVL